MMHTKQFWLMKSEPSEYSIDRLEKEKTTPWDGVRNYQARNFMRDRMKLKDLVLFYHSNAKPTGIVGLAEVSKLAYPDFTAFDKTNKHYDPKSTPEKPIWMMVDLVFKEKFKAMITLHDLKKTPELNDMLVVKKGMRLSVQPVQKEHISFILNSANSKFKLRK